MIQGAMHRNQYASKLNEHLNFAYSKERGIGTLMYQVLLPKQNDAIRNARTILQQWDGVSPAQAESSTKVHLLVEELNKYL